MDSAYKDVVLNGVGGNEVKEGAVQIVAKENDVQVHKFQWLSKPDSSETTNWKRELVKWEEFITKACGSRKSNTERGFGKRPIVSGKPPAIFSLTQQLRSPRPPCSTTLTEVGLKTTRTSPSL